MNIVIPLLAVVILLLIGLVGASTGSLDYAFGVIIPCVAVVIFILGFVYRILKWARSPVPFRIPTTCGQQKALGWIKYSKLEAPHNGLQVIGRMALEILFFRSLFRNTKTELRKGPRIIYGADKWLWAAALAFHWSFLIIFIRHYRFFIEPIPSYLLYLQSLDGLMQIGVPVLFMSDITIVLAVTFLFFRRVVIPQIRYISLQADYFPLLLILGIACTGIWMRYFGKIDVVGVKELTMSMIAFSPTVPAGLDPVFFTHLFLVSVLLVYFPFSKLMHLGGIFLSPTRNLANNNRQRRHVNPWNPKVKFHTYEEYEDEFRDVMREAGLPLEKDS